jgi:heme exporter protein B
MMKDQVLAVFKKDILSEVRTRYAINSLVMFVIVTISVILFSVGSESIAPNLTGGLFWVVVFFTAMSGLARVFVTEEERGTTLTLRLLAKPSAIYLGKLLFNITLIFSMNSIIALLYSMMFDSFVIKSKDVFFVAFMLGNLGIATASTILAAIIAKASSKGTLYPVLSFPILLPLILILINLSKSCIDGTSFVESQTELFMLVCYNVLMITASLLLFDFIWKD